MINIINEMGVTEKVSVVRFFKANNANYLMYTLNEKDETGYIKLYAAKMLDNATFSKIEEDKEWDLVKELIKAIVKEAKDNTLVSVEDLDFSKLEGIKVLGTRVFKLTEQVSEMLGANKKTFLKENDTVSVKSSEEEKINKLENLMFVEPTLVEKEEKEAQSFEELLEQVKPKIEELFFVSPVVEEKVLESVLPTETQSYQPTVEEPKTSNSLEELFFETPKVEKSVIEEKVLEPVLLTETQIVPPTIEPTKKISTLEELLGQYTEEPKKEEPKIEITNNLNNEDIVKKMEARIAELETKLAKIQEILK